MTNCGASPPNGRGMEFVCEELDRTTGELETRSLGLWMTISEFAQEMDVGVRQGRLILVDMDFMFVANGENGKRWTQICPWVEERDWGKRIFPRRGSKTPFDVINEDARLWIKERWDESKDRVLGLGHEASLAALALNEFLSRRKDPDEDGLFVQIHWLSDHFSNLSQAEIARIVGVTQQAVSKSISERKKGLRKMYDLLNSYPDIPPRDCRLIPLGVPQS